MILFKRQFLEPLQYCKQIFDSKSYFHYLACEQNFSYKHKTLRFMQMENTTDKTKFRTPSSDNQMTKYTALDKDSDLQSSITQYELVKRSDQPIIKFDDIIAEFFKDDDCQTKANTIKQKNRKQNRKIMKVQPKTTTKSPHADEIDKKLNSISLKMIKDYQKLINSSYKTFSELQKFENVKKKILFKYLCFGLQQVNQKRKQINEESTTQQVSFAILKARTDEICQSLTKSKNHGKTHKVSVILQSQWKFILTLVSQIENDRLRGAILARTVPSQLLCSPQQNNFIDYLTIKRQKQLKQMDQFILKSSLADEKKIIFEMQKDPTLQNRYQKTKEQILKQPSTKDKKKAKPKPNTKREKPQTSISKSQIKDLSSGKKKKGQQKQSD